MSLLDIIILLVRCKWIVVYNGIHYLPTTRYWSKYSLINLNESVHWRVIIKEWFIRYLTQY